MRIYAEKKVTQRQLVEYQCDKCKKIISHEFELQEAYTISFTGGYLSDFGDGITVNCDLCQQCLKEIIGDFCTYS